MDDLSGLDWTSSSKNLAKNPTPASNYSNVSFPTLRPTPSPSSSGRSTPFNVPQASNGSAPKISKPNSKPATPVNDPFASFSSKVGKSAVDTRTLQERQQALLEEKTKQFSQERSQFDSYFGAGGTHLDKLSDYGSAPASRGRSPLPRFNDRDANAMGSGISTGTSSVRATSGGDDDILAAFNSSASVDTSSYYPPPVTGSSSSFRESKNVPLPSQSAYQFDTNDDDDPFGLNSMKRTQPAPSTRVEHDNEEDDDILGMLGKPVAEVKKAAPKPSVEHKMRRPKSPSKSSAEDGAVSELVEMGFTPDQAAIALAQTDTGVDVQAAVGIILSQAHAASKQKARKDPKQDTTTEARPERSRKNDRERGGNASVPSWMREENGRARAGRSEQSPSGAKDAQIVAQEIGASLFKSANSLWKAGSKKVQQAMADFDGGKADSSQPKWMKDTQGGNFKDSSRVSEKSSERGPENPRGPAVNDFTDEAAMLDGGGPPAKPPRRLNQDASLMSRSRDVDPQVRQQPRREPEAALSVRSSRPGNASRMTRQQLEDQTPETYISPARRRRPQAPSSDQTTDDIFNAPLPAPPSTVSSSVPPKTLAQSRPDNSIKTIDSHNKMAAPTRPPRKQAPPRQIPPVSASTLAMSSKHRLSGTEAFKRGDYGAAHEAYTSALSPLPPSHPITIVVLCNRALTSIKNGHAKEAVVDADAALKVIGPSKGENETIVISPGEEKSMRELYGKALMRKAEGLEHLERWSDAAVVWREAVEANVGGAVSIQGRNRCDRAAGGPSKTISSSSSSTPITKPSPARRRPQALPARSALSDLGGAGGQDSEAVRQLRAQNAAQSAEDDAKFALTDTVDAKLTAWKGTKKDNLRALLGSLDLVMWPAAGWKKVGMGDLVLPGKVKIVYMKAIARVHPDKIPSDATTEQKMISAAVFATLNEAWDKFKTDNGL